MLWFFIGHFFSILLSLIHVSRLSKNDKDLEIIILRHQLDVMVRKQKKPIRPNRAEKATLALLTAQLKQNTQRTIRQLGDSIRIVPTPIQAPNANATGERWIRTVREECLDHILIINEAHLRRVLIEFIDYYNSRRPHQSLDQPSPIPREESVTTGKVEHRQVLGGIINDYFRAPDTTAVCLA